MGIEKNTQHSSDQPEFLTVEEAAQLLRMPEVTVARMLRTRQLPGIYGGTRVGWRIARADILAFRTNPPQPSTPRVPTRPDEFKEHHADDANRG